MILVSVSIRVFEKDDFLSRDTSSNSSFIVVVQLLGAQARYLAQQMFAFGDVLTPFWFGP